VKFIKQIEAELKSCGQSPFQDLVNHLLYVKGNKFVGAPGSVVAKEKTSKGAPDSFFVKDGKYIFVECTTQERLGKSKSFYEKLQKDIVHCFDKEKTGIDAADIERVILACNEKINPEEYDSLLKEIRNKNNEATLEVYNIQNLPFEIYDYPGLAEQYLGVVIVKGEIFSLSDFLQKTAKGIQPALTNEFVGRSDEMEESLKLLENSNVLLLSGPAGVGKSKLAVTILEEVSKLGYIPIVIQSSVVPLWDDFTNLFQNQKDYVILFDDANKSVPNLSYLLDFILKQRPTRFKLVITSRDYVKRQVTEKLSNISYNEVVIDRLKDEQIEQVILKALVNLKHYPDIRKKIVDLAKGNARLALMATYSVVPEAETNYLSSPVLLYEKYFEKVAEEINAFTKPIALQAIAIVSFFGILDRYSKKLPELLRVHFKVDWDELWEAILELHTQEILDVYENEIVKVSDQVLATYAFYKCFVDPKTSKLNYAKWIETFLPDYSTRIKTTLVDINNTFSYHLIRDLVLPHLQTIVAGINDKDTLYKFYELFWFYKGYDTLYFIKSWNESVPYSENEEPLKFQAENDKYSKPGKYLELIVNFFDHPNELLTPAIGLAIDLGARQPAYLPAIVKFMSGRFEYTYEDVYQGYERQNVFLEVLLTETRSDIHIKIANYIFLNTIKKLLGWHFTHQTSRGIQFTITNFDLVYSPKLTALRRKMLSGFTTLFDDHPILSAEILHKINFPGAKIDPRVTAEELTCYDLLIRRRLSADQFTHCKFVKKLAESFTEQATAYPEGWDVFINSELMQLSAFLNAELTSRGRKAWQEREQEKRKAFQEFVADKEWPEIEAFLYKVNSFYQQQEANAKWFTDQSISDILIAIAKKDKGLISQTLRLFFSGRLTIPFSANILYFMLNESILSGNVLLKIIREFEFKGKSFWITILLTALPDKQIDDEMLQLLMGVVSETDAALPIHSVLDYQKYDMAFLKYRDKHAEANLEGHNVISWITERLLEKIDRVQVSFGHEFCRQCAPFLKAHLHLLKKAYYYLKEEDSHFDHDGEELNAILAIDRYFFVEYLELKTADPDIFSFTLENFKLAGLWAFPDYDEILNQALKIMVKNVPVFSNSDHIACSLFTFEEPDQIPYEKVNGFILKYIADNCLDAEAMHMMMNVALHQFRSQYVSFLKEVLSRNKSLDFLKGLQFDPGGVYSGSRVPRIQHEIDLVKEIVAMVRRLPGVLDFCGHINYLEQNIGWLKKDIEREQRRDFEDMYE
jgi:DNA replication protein DnaC